MLKHALTLRVDVRHLQSHDGGSDGQKTGNGQGAAAAGGDGDGGCAGWRGWGGGCVGLERRGACSGGNGLVGGDDRGGRWDVCSSGGLWNWCNWCWDGRGRVDWYDWCNVDSSLARDGGWAGVDSGGARCARRWYNHDNSGCGLDVVDDWCRGGGDCGSAGVGYWGRLRRGSSLGGWDLDLAVRDLGDHGTGDGGCKSSDGEDVGEHLDRFGIDDDVVERVVLVKKNASN